MEPLDFKYDWPYPRGREYKLIFDVACEDFRLPPGLLARVAWQESRFREDIISGRKVSKAGATGIMQIVPRWHPNVDPLDVPAAIRYAAKYLAHLRDVFGTWELALAAYNWGPANLFKYRGQREKWPLETSNYSREILADAYEHLANRPTT